MLKKSERNCIMIKGKKLVALCTSRVYDPQIHGYIERLSELLKKNGCSLLIFTMNSDIYWEEDRLATDKYVYDLIPYEFIDAIIIMDEKIKSHKIADKVITNARTNNIPVVIADGTYQNTSNINFDYEKGFEKVVRHVIEYHKVRHPHMMAGQPDNDFSNRRIEVFKKVLKENNIPFDNSMLSYGYFWSDPCRIAMQKLLDRGSLPEAIICANDNMAITVSEMLTEAGYKVPDDIIVTGFDGYDEIFFTTPKITSAFCDIILLAEATAEITLKTIEDHKSYTHFIEPTFISNESCGCDSYMLQSQMLRDWFNESFSRHNDDNRVLQQLTTSMQISESPGELVSHLECYKTDNILCIIDRNCLNPEVNYFTDSETNKRPKELIMIYDSDHPDNYKIDTFHISDDSTDDADLAEHIFCPNYKDRVIELLDSGYPLIFNSLDYMNVPFGFVCYYFRNYYISNYSNTLNATNAISIGIGGYINLQYQRVLLEKMDKMYRHDPLTGLYNRVGFMKHFQNRLKYPEYKNIKVTVIMSDLDGLKYINDTFGHAEGDNAIAVTAKALSDATPENGLSARFGGDELFSVIFGEHDPEKIIQHIYAYLDSYNKSSDKPYIVSTSCGYSISVLDENFDITQAVKDADSNMYNVKNNKRNMSDKTTSDSYRDLAFHRNKARQYLAGLNLEDKIKILYGTFEEKLGLEVPFIDFFGEAAHGVQARHDQPFDFGPPVSTTVFPNPIGMAASFDKDMMHRIGEVVGTEMRSLANEFMHNGLCAFAPTVDMERDPRWGRNEEGYGEDPHLTSRMAGEYILGMAGDDKTFIRCGATLKHFYANNYENERYSSDSRIPEHLIKDYYFRVFKEIIEYAHPASVMTSYNKINGTSAAFNPEVKDIIKKDVPFIVSDAISIQHTVEKHHSADSPIDALRKALDAGIDGFLEDIEFEKPAMLEALDKGIIKESDIDEALTNKLTVYSMLGLMKSDLNTDGSSKAFPKSEYNISRVDTEESRQLSREAAAKSSVLLKNDGMLPLESADKAFAFGPFTDSLPLDWYSGVPSRKTTLKEGLNVKDCHLIPQVRIRLSDSSTSNPVYAGIKDSALYGTDIDNADTFELMLWDDCRVTIRSMSTGKLLTSIPPEHKVVIYEKSENDYTLYANADESFSWFANEAFQLIDSSGDIIHFTEDTVSEFWTDNRITGIKNHDGSMALTFETVKDISELIHDAIKDNSLGSDTDIIACFGLHPIVNCKEERDRDSIELPVFQRYALRELRKTFTNISLIIMANAPVAVVEEDNSPEIRSILWTAFGSEELGNGLADIILGRISPSGRLPQTWYRDDSQLPDIEDYDIEKNKVTYIYMIDEPLYRFGYGLTFSDFNCNMAFSDENKCTIHIKNTGNFVSDYVIQLYQSPDNELYLYGNDRHGLDVSGRKIPVGSILIYFDRIHDIAPGDEVTISI